MASAAAARKPAKPARSAPLPQTVLDLGYLAMPRDFGRLFRCCSLIELGIIWQIAENTVGLNEADPESGERPEWTKFSEPELAAQLNVTPDGVQLAIRNLLAARPKPLIEARGRNGVRREYRVLFENFSVREERPPRKIDRPEPPSPGPLNAYPMVLRSGSAPRRLTLGSPVEDVFFRSETPSAVELHHSVENGALNVSIKLHEISKSEPPDSTTGVETEIRGVRTPGKIGKAAGKISPPPDSTTGVAQAPPPTPLRGSDAASADRQRRVRDFLAPIVAQSCGRNLDPRLVERIAAELESKPFENFERAVVNWLRKISSKGGFVSPGIFLRLAQDAAHFEAPRGAKPEPESPPIAHVHEPDDSGSPWMRIRQYLRATLTEIQYRNWFLPTAFVRLAGRKLLVAVDSQATAEWLDQEFGERIRAAIHHLGLEIDRVEFAVHMAAAAKGHAS